MLASNVKPILGSLSAIAMGVVGGWIFLALTSDASSLTVEAPTVRVSPAPYLSVPAPVSAPEDPIRVRKSEGAPDAQPQFAPEPAVQPTRDSSVSRKRKKLRERTARRDKDDDDD